MYMPGEFSGVCVREEVKGTRDEPEADIAFQ